MSPDVYVIARPNGAGKTTFAREFLVHYSDCRTFVNADLIAEGLSPFSPDAAAFRAGRLVLTEIELLAKRRATFAFETTLSGRAHLGLIADLKERGYSVHLFFLWLPGVELALSRVKGRVMKGGHDVPESVVRRRFERSISNFFREYCRLADSWMLFDNSGAVPGVIAFTKEGEIHIMNAESYRDLLFKYSIHE